MLAHPHTVSSSRPALPASAGAAPATARAMAAGTSAAVATVTLRHGPSSSVAATRASAASCTPEPG
eukprot:scaffold12071_cov101-Isochrysis_galbana.AAC.4